MAQFISRKKVSKKKKREIDRIKRVTWGQTNPVTKIVPSGKLYRRKKNKLIRDEPVKIDYKYID